MGLHQISAIVVILAIVSARAQDDFPSRTNIPSDCPEASHGCWCQGSFAQCWRTYEDSHMTEVAGQRITQLELLYRPNEEVVTYIRHMSALTELRISEDGMSLACLCDVIYALDDKEVALVNKAELTFKNCREHGFPLDTMSGIPFVRQCRRLRLEHAQLRKRRDADDGGDDDVSKRASPRKGDKPAGHKIRDLEPSPHITDTHHLVSIDAADQQEHHPATEFFNFISGHRRTRRSTTNDGDAEVSGDSERGDRKKRYGNNYGNYPQAMNPQMGGGNYPAPVAGQGQAGYMNPAQPQGMAGPVGGGAMPGGAMARPVGGGGGAGGGAMGAGPPEFGAFSQTEGQDDYSSGSSSSAVDGTISAKVMENIKAVLGATKIDLPVDINDPYDLGLLLRHLRHHSNLLANIGDPEVREQVLSAMQEEEAEEEEDAANGVRDNVLNNLNGPGHAGFGGAPGGGMQAAGMGAPGGAAGTGGGMMGMQGMGGQAPARNAYNTGYRQG